MYYGRCRNHEGSGSNWLMVEMAIVGCQLQDGKWQRANGYHESVLVAASAPYRDCYADGVAWAGARLGCDWQCQGRILCGEHQFGISWAGFPDSLPAAGATHGQIPANESWAGAKGRGRGAASRFRLVRVAAFDARVGFRAHRHGSGFSGCCCAGILLGYGRYGLGAGVDRMDQ